MPLIISSRKLSLGAPATHLSRLAQTSLSGSGRARRLCPGISDVDLFSYCKRIVDLDAEVANGTLDLGMPKQELNRAQIASPLVDQCRLGPPKGMRPKQRRVETDANNPFRQQPRLLPRRQRPFRSAPAEE